MQIRHVPSIGIKYWTALCLASVFGANTGDFFAGPLKLGHLAGLPVLAVLFTIAIILERFDRFRHFAYFWFVIIIIRTSATNLGDLSHDLKFSPPLVMAVLAVLLLSVIMLWKTLYSMRKTDIFTTNPLYWFSMLIAGTAGTVIGDYFSYGLRLGNLYATAILGGILASFFVIFRNGLKKENVNIFFYWITVVTIRSAGTAAGDLIAHSPIRLPLATLITGVIFAAVLLFWKENENGRLGNKLLQAEN